MRPPLRLLLGILVLLAVLSALFHGTVHDLFSPSRYECVSLPIAYGAHSIDDLIRSKNLLDSQDLEGFLALLKSETTFPIYAGTRATVVDRASPGMLKIRLADSHVTAWVLARSVKCE